MSTGNKRKILIVCSSAGSAEILSAYAIDQAEDSDFICLASGTAKKIFIRKGLKDCLISDNGKLIELLLKTNSIKMVLAGTGILFSASMEVHYINLMKRHNIKTVAYLDHWTNYRERFGYPQKNWKKNLPNEIWAGDKYAYVKAKNIFSSLPVKLHPNPYFREIKEEFKKANKNNNRKNKAVLIVSQPFINSSEFILLRKILDYFAKQKNNQKIILRLHPSEKKDKYNDIISKYADKLTITKSGGQNIVSDLRKCSYAIGINSMGLVAAYLCGKKVISLLTNPKEFKLPFKEIIKIKNVNEMEKIIKK